MAAPTKFLGIAWSSTDHLHTVECMKPDVEEEEGDTMMFAPAALPTPRAADTMASSMAAPYLQRLASSSYQVFSELVLQQQQQASVAIPQVVGALEGYETSLMQSLQHAAQVYAAAHAGEQREEAHDDLLRLTMSSAIMRLCRVFFFDAGTTDLSGALQQWFAAFSAGAGVAGGHLNILNPESCLEDEELWGFLHHQGDAPTRWKDPQWCTGASSLGWRQVYALVTTGQLDHAWALLVQIEHQRSSVSEGTKDIVQRWAALLRAGAGANDFVPQRQQLCEDIERHMRSGGGLRPEERALLGILSGDDDAFGRHEPINWIEHLVATLLYGRAAGGSGFISPIYSKESIGEALVEASIERVERAAARSGQEVCTFMNVTLFREVCVQQARGVLLQISDPEVAIGFTWLQMHLGHVFHVAQRLVDDLPIPAGPFQGSSYLEALLLEYGEQLRVVPQLQHLALRVYLGCPVYGAEYIQELLQRMPVLSEREGRKLLSFAAATRQTEAQAVVCKTLAARAVAGAQYGAATYWLLQMDDAERVDALAERMLVEMASSVVPALASGTAEAAWVDFEQDLHSTAAVAKQAAITDQVQIPECLHFLCEYSQLHRELAQLQGHKARVTSSEEQALPELQETVEKGVDCAVARLMPMFGAPPRFWALLLLAVRQLCGICNPAFDRDETVVLMRRLEEYADLCSYEADEHVSELVPLDDALLGGIRYMLADNLAACIMNYE